MKKLCSIGSSSSSRRRRRRRFRWSWIADSGGRSSGRNRGRWRGRSGRCRRCADGGCCRSSVGSRRASVAISISIFLSPSSCEPILLQTIQTINDKSTQRSGGSGCSSGDGGRSSQGSVDGAKGRTVAEDDGRDGVVLVARCW